MWGLVLSIVLIIVGLALLALAGDKLVDFAAAIAIRARLTPTVVGLTIVALGTSLPELFVSVLAAIRGNLEISVANVVGSNIANIALILGLVSLFVAIPVAKAVLKFDYPLMLAATVLVCLAGLNATIGRWEAGFFTIAMIAYLTYAVWKGRKDADAKAAAGQVDEPDEEVAVRAKRSGWYLAGGTIASLAALGAGAHVLIIGAVDVAEYFQVSERIIGLTVVAFGTSLPELVASVAAAMKRQHEMAVANVVGSNMFNLLFVLGITGLITDLPVTEYTLKMDLWVMLGVALLLFPLARSGYKITRPEGVVFTAIYVGYFVALILFRD